MNVKKLLFGVMLPLALAACDRSTSVAELSCYVDEHWQYVADLYLQNNYPDNNRRDTKININVTTYDNYATVTFDDITTTFEKVAQEKHYGEFGNVLITYKGNFPGSERTALLTVYGDIAGKKILQYNIAFIGEKENLNGREFTINRYCEPVRAEHKGNDGWSAAVPFNHNYKMPNKIERCITEIGNTVYCVSQDENENCDTLTVMYNGNRLNLSQKDALSISKNWDYKNMKLYVNDGKLEEHEMDACDVLDRLNKFIHDYAADVAQ